MRGINLIYGEKPEFGNPEHIRYVKMMDAVLSGITNFYKIDWKHCQTSGATTDTGKPKFKYVDYKNANAVVDSIHCPKCKRYHVLLVEYDPQDNWTDTLISIGESVKEFTCWSCGLEFETDGVGNVYVKQPE